MLRVELSLIFGLFNLFDIAKNEKLERTSISLNINALF